MHLLRKVEDKKSKVESYIIDKINQSLMENPKLRFENELKSWNGASIGGQRSIKEFNRLIDLIHLFENEVKKDKIDKHYYYLNGFIHQAINNDIETVFKSKSNDNSFDAINTDFDISTESFQRFQRELKQLPTREIVVNVKKQFLPMIKRYFDWYELNKEKTKKFEPNNFYEQMYENMLSTKGEILMYEQVFDESNTGKINMLPPPTEKKEGSNEGKKLHGRTKTKNAKYIFIVSQYIEGQKEEGLSIKDAKNRAIANCRKKGYPISDKIFREALKEHKKELESVNFQDDFKWLQNHEKK